MNELKEYIQQWIDKMNSEEYAMEDPDLEYVLGEILSKIEEIENK